MYRAFRYLLSPLIILILLAGCAGWLEAGQPLPPTVTAAPAEAHRYVDAHAAGPGDGLSWATAWQTLSEAAQAPLAPGTIVHIAPGIYRETLAPQHSGTAAAPITYRAENGPGTVFILGSETSTSLGAAWQPLSAYGAGLALQTGVDAANIYFIEADWTWQMAWDPGYGDTFPIETDLIALPSSAKITDAQRLPQAQEPDWTVDQIDQQHANWWTADGGASGLAAASPSDSNVFLMDTASDHNADWDDDGQPDFPNLPPGSLQSAFTGSSDFWDPRADSFPGDAIRQNPLLPSILFADGRTGHYLPRFNILDYSASSGVIELDNPRPWEGPDGEGHFITDYTKFYVQGAPRAMDCPGEWVHHDGRIFILTGDASAAGCGYTLGTSDLPQLEIARRFTLLQVTDESHLRFEDLDFAFNNYAKYGYDYYGSGGDDYPAYLNYPRGAIDLISESQPVNGVILDSISLTHAATGIYAGYPDQTSDFTLQNSTLAQIDGTAILVQAPDSGGWEGIRIRKNHFQDLGFRPQIGEGVGINLSRVGNLVFQDNLLEDVAHNGVQFHQGWGDFVSHNILVIGNTFNGACRMAYDCAGLKFHGGGKGYQNVLVMDNLSENNAGWSYAAWRIYLPYRQSEPDGWWPHTVLGALGMGVYMDYASGVTVYRNLLVSNSAAGVFFTGNYREDQPNLVIHNTIAHTLDGVNFSDSYNDLSHTDSRVLGNLLVNCENAGTHYAYSSGDVYHNPDLSAQNVQIDYNFYKPYPTPPDPAPWYGYDSGWYEPAVLEYLTSGNSWEPYLTLAFLQDHTLWEDHGAAWQTGQPLFVDENGGNFSLAPESAAIDQGLPVLPDALTSLLDHLQSALNVTITDQPLQGASYDAGAFEFSAADQRYYLPMLIKENCENCTASAFDFDR